MSHLEDDNEPAGPPKRPREVASIVSRLGPRPYRAPLSQQLTLAVAAQCLCGLGSESTGIRPSLTSRGGQAECLFKSGTIIVPT
jgi:hypothetical protein